MVLEAVLGGSTLLSEMPGRAVLPWVLSLTERCQAYRLLLPFGQRSGLATLWAMV